MSELPPGWVWTDTGTVTEVQGGIQKQPKRRPKVHRYPFLRVANVLRGRLDLREVHEIELFDGELEKFRLRVGDLLVVEGNGSPDQIGRAACWHGDIEDCVHQNHLIRVRPAAAIDSKYLTYYWNASRTTEYLRSIASSTSGLYVLTAAKVRGVRLPLPPLEEQRRIVAAIEEQFSRLDAGVAALQRAQRELVALNKAIILAAVPEIYPRHWQRTTVGQAGEVMLGRMRTPKYHNGPKMRRYLRVANVFEDRIDSDDIMSMHFDDTEFARYRLHPNDILLNEGQSPHLLGRPAMYRGDPPDVAFTNSLLRFRSGSYVLPNWALLVFRRHLHAKRFMRESQITTNIAHLSAGRFKVVEFPIPPIEEQERIVASVEAQLSGTAQVGAALDAQQALANALRSSILSTAFAGLLVAQDPIDEPASTLLERIAADRASFNGRKPARIHRPRPLREGVVNE